MVQIFLLINVNVYVCVRACVKVIFNCFRENMAMILFYCRCKNTVVKKSFYKKITKLSRLYNSLP